MLARRQRYTDSTWGKQLSRSLLWEAMWSVCNTKTSNLRCAPAGSHQLVAQEDECGAELNFAGVPFPGVGPRRSGKLATLMGDLLQINRCSHCRHR